MLVSDINFCSTKIRMFKAGTELGSASGFFFRHKDMKYLATNRHVVIDESDGFFPTSLALTLHLDRSDLTKNQVIEVQLYDSDRPLWKQHPLFATNECDVVLIPLTQETLSNSWLSRFNATSVTFIGSEIINTRPVNPFGDIVVIGYPLGFHDELHNLPVIEARRLLPHMGSILTDYLTF